MERITRRFTATNERYTPRLPRDTMRSMRRFALPDSFFQQMDDRGISVAQVAVDLGHGEQLVA